MAEMLRRQNVQVQEVSKEPVQEGSETTDAGDTQGQAGLLLQGRV